MNPPHRSSSVHRSAVPGYRKWYFGAGGSQSGSTRRVRLSGQPEPDPLPFEAIRIHEERTVGPPSTSADGYSAHGTFAIPEGADGKKTLRHLLALPWGGRLGKPGSQGLQRQRGGAGGSEGKPADGGNAGRAQLPHGNRRGAAPLRLLHLGSQPDQHRLQTGKRQHLHLQLQHRRGADGAGGQEGTRTVSLRGRHMRQQWRNAALPAAGPVGP